MKKQFEIVMFLGISGESDESFMEKSTEYIALGTIDLDTELKNDDRLFEMECAVRDLVKDQGILSLRRHAGDYARFLVTQKIPTQTMTLLVASDNGLSQTYDGHTVAKGQDRLNLFIDVREDSFY
jgi:hypothetical protein